jgi:hypothetical protein
VLEREPGIAEINRLKIAIVDAAEAKNQHAMKDNDDKSSQTAQKTKSLRKTDGSPLGVCSRL